MKCRLLIVLASLVLGVLSTSAIESVGEASQQLEKKAVQKTDVPAIKYSNIPRPVPDILPERIIRRKPVLLTPEKRIALVEAVRRVARISTAMSANLPCEVKLTPDAPRSGDSYFNLWRGNNITGLNERVSEIDQNSALHFNFATIPGKTYLLDLEVWEGFTAGPLAPGGATWKFEGVVEASIVPTEDSHLLASFTANQLMSSVRVKQEPVSEYVTQEGAFFSICVTRVD